MLLGAMVLTFSAAAIGAIASAQAGVFYAELVRPPWAPPGWLFGPVWTVLYALMGVSAWLVWRKHGFASAQVAWGFFLAQLVANALWSWLFFAWHQGALALADVVLLWGLIVATMVAFARLDKPAALLLVPYLVWVAFAAVLNLALWRLNPGLL